MKKRNTPKSPAKSPNPGVAAAIRAAGSQTELAALLSVEQPAVHYWLYHYCPPERAKEIEEMLGVSRKQICPEIFG